MSEEQKSKEILCSSLHICNKSRAAFWHKIKWNKKLLIFTKLILVRSGNSAIRKYAGNRFWSKIFYCKRGYTYSNGGSMILANLISQAHKTECTLNVFCVIHCQYKRCDLLSIVNFRRIWVRFTLLGRHQFGSQRVHPTIDVRRCRPKVKLRISSPTRMVRKYHSYKKSLAFPN